MYDVHIEVESLVYIYVYVGSRTIFFPVVVIVQDLRLPYVVSIDFWQYIKLKLK